MRLSFGEDGWATDPDGIHDPLPGKRKLQEGCRWGAVLDRVGPAGERRFCGLHLEQDDIGAGRLAFVVNDKDHWQNNPAATASRCRLATRSTSVPRDSRKALSAAFAPTRLGCASTRCCAVARMR